MGVGEKGLLLLLLDYCTQGAGLAGARDDPRETLLGPHDCSLRDDAAAVIVRVRGVADDVEDLELLGLARLGVADVDDVRVYQLRLLDAGVSAHRLRLLLTLHRLDWVPADLVYAASPVGSLLAARRLALC